MAIARNNRTTYVQLALLLFYFCIIMLPVTAFGDLYLFQHIDHVNVFVT